ncbi:retrovirus-related pol polyprotein from transposon TNT 1-94 [Tanacetum coccineum]
MVSDHVSSDPVPQYPTMALEQDSLSPGLQSQQNVPQVAETVTTLNELDFLFSLMFDELLTGTTPVVSKPSVVTAADAPDQPKRYNQQEGIDFEESFALVARLEAISYSLHGFVDPHHPEKVYRLKKALYGLKQAPRAWYDEVSNFRVSKGFSRGIQIHQSPRGIFINQAKYAQKILKKHGMTSCDSIGTPMATKPLDADLSGTPVDQTKYRGDKLVSWSSKKHNCTSMSIAEAEYVSLSACYAQVLWLRTQLTYYGFHFDKIPITEYQLADLSTKALPEDRFKYLVRQLGMRCLTPEELEVLANKSA